MQDRTVKIPGPDHPITIVRSGDRAVVTAGGKSIADSLKVLILREASYPPVYYLPRGDVDMAQLAATEHQTWCPYKGVCAYFSIPAAGERGANAVWSYEQPHAAVAEIKGFLAFYPNRVDSIEISPGA